MIGKIRETVLVNGEEHHILLDAGMILSVNGMFG